MKQRGNDIHTLKHGWYFRLQFIKQHSCLSITTGLDKFSSQEKIDTKITMIGYTLLLNALFNFKIRHSYGQLKEGPQNDKKIPL